MPGDASSWCVYLFVHVLSLAAVSVVIVMSVVIVIVMSVVIVMLRSLLLLNCVKTILWPIAFDTCDNYG